MRKNNENIYSVHDYMMLAIKTDKFFERLLNFT